MSSLWLPRERAGEGWLQAVFARTRSESGLGGHDPGPRRPAGKLAGAGALVVAAKVHRAIGARGRPAVCRRLAGVQFVSRLAARRLTGFGTRSSSGETRGSAARVRADRTRGGGEAFGYRALLRRFLARRDFADRLRTEQSRRESERERLGDTRKVWRDDGARALSRAAGSRDDQLRPCPSGVHLGRSAAF